MASLEDLRDLYKSSTKSKHLETKSNGSTYSNVYKNEIYKRGNLIYKTNVGGGGKNTSSLELDERYAINSTELPYSLNKKGRWRMALDLKQNMRHYADDDIDVRLYETCDRIRASYDNCISFSQSKGNNLKFHSTYANKDSIRKSLALEAKRLKNPEQESERSGKKMKKKNLKKNDNTPESIVIDIADDSDDEVYTEYQIEYPAATMEVLKYNTLFETKIKDRVSSKLSKNILGDELNKNKYYDYDMECIDYDDDDDDYEEDESSIKKNRNEFLSLNDLINEYTKPIVEKRRGELKKKQQPIDVNVDENKLRKLIFISRQNSRVDNNNNNTSKAVATSNLVKAAMKKVNTETNSKSSTTEPLVFNTKIHEASLTSDKLKEKFGSKYSEAINTWPRIIAINLNDDLVEKIDTENNSRMLNGWLSIKEIPSNNGEEVVECKSYCLTVHTNSSAKLTTFEINANDEHDFEQLYKTIIHKIVTQQPLESFKLKDKNINKKILNNNAFVGELPTIACKSVCKEADDLKYELLNKQQQQSTAVDSIETLSTSSSMSDLENEIDEIKVKQKLDQFFNNKTCSCELCYEENIPIGECTILLNCAHSVCNSCWKNYIEILVNDHFTKAGHLLCPVCDDVELDFALIVNFMTDIEKFEKYVESSVDRIISVVSNYKWCQSAGCNKAIKVDLTSTPYGILSCECGYKTCLKCNQEPHFPAKCSQIAKYYTQLKANNEFLISKNEIYTGIGKKCPKCFVFMEKNGGCNQMVCTMCKTSFCWNCVNIWSKHLELTNGNHACTVRLDTKKVVTVEFKKEKKPIRTIETANLYDYCVYHREQRSQQNNYKRNKNIKRLMGTIKQNELLTGDYDFMSSSSSVKQQIENLTLYEKCKIELEKRQEVRQFLQKALSFLNELHFVCEHAYVLIKDEAGEFKQRTLNIISSIELIIWKIKTIFESSTGLSSLKELKELLNKGLNCLNEINKLHSSS